MTSDEKLTVHTDARGRNLDEAVGFYERVYASPDIHIGSAVDDGFSWRYRAIGDEDLTIGTSSVAARRWGIINSDGQYILAWATGPGITLDVGSRTPTVMLPNTPVMYPAGRPFRFDALPTTQHLVRFDGVFLEAIAAAYHHAPPGPLTFESTPSPTAVARLRTVIGAAAGELLQPGTDHAVRRALNLTIAEATVAAFVVAPAIGFPMHDGPSTMRLAQEWIVANARRPLTVADVSTASGVAVRSLQSSFQRHAGMSPMRFLQQVRLHRVHDELLDAEPAATTVGQVALGWGFRHLGRFSGFYAATFGEPPSHTLRRRRHDPSSAANNPSRVDGTGSDRVTPG